MIHASHNRVGFTLVELLVVIAIIIALLAILMPAMGRSIELSHRAVCLSSQRQAVAGCLTYAGDYYGLLPPSNFDTNGDGVVPFQGEPWSHSFDYRAPNAGGPIGIGLLANGYVASGTFPGWVHCPSMDTSNAYYTAQGFFSNTPYVCMDVPYDNWWGGVGASYWNDPAFDTKRIVGAYNYRALSWFRVRGEYLRVTSNGGNGRLLIQTDIIDPRFGINFTHREGYMHVFLDGGGAWYEDTTLELESLSLVGGGIVQDGWSAAWEDEGVYAQMERGSQ